MLLNQVFSYVLPGNIEGDQSEGEFKDGHQVDVTTVFPLISAKHQISAAPLGIHIEISTSL